jgi:hypothetical protein
MRKDNGTFALSSSPTDTYRIDCVVPFGSLMEDLMLLQRQDDELHKQLSR